MCDWSSIQFDDLHDQNAVTEFFQVSYAPENEIKLKYPLQQVVLIAADRFLSSDTNSGKSRNEIFLLEFSSDILMHYSFWAKIH